MVMTTTNQNRCFVDGRGGRLVHSIIDPTTTIGVRNFGSVHRSIRHPLCGLCVAVYGVDTVAT